MAKPSVEGPSTLLADEWYKLELHKLTDKRLCWQLNTIREGCLNILCGIHRQKRINHNAQVIWNAQQAILYMQEKRAIQPHNQGTVYEVDYLTRQTHRIDPEAFALGDTPLPRLVEKE